jgi:hypothetical protein
MGGENTYKYCLSADSRFCPQWFFLKCELGRPEYRLHKVPVPATNSTLPQWVDPSTGYLRGPCASNVWDIESQKSYLVAKSAEPANASGALA